MKNLLLCEFKRVFVDYTVQQKMQDAFLGMRTRSLLSHMSKRQNKILGMEIMDYIDDLTVGQEILEVLQSEIDNGIIDFLYVYLIAPFEQVIKRCGYKPDEEFIEMSEQAVEKKEFTVFDDDEPNYENFDCISEDEIWDMINSQMKGDE